MSMFKTRIVEVLEPSPGEAPLSWPSDVTDEIDDDAFADAIAAGRLLDPESAVTVAD